jgi:hypothetical protein
MITFLRMVLDLAGVGSSRRIRRRMYQRFYACSSLDQMVFGRGHPCFIPNVWFRRERREALSFVATRRLSIHGEVRGGEFIKARFGDLSMEV